MKTRLTNLNETLHEQLERLNNDEMSAEQFETEIKRTKAISDISSQIIDNAKLVLEGAKLRAQYNEHIALPEMLEEKGPLERDDG